MHATLDLTAAKGIEIFSELGLQRDNREPFYRDSQGHIVAFRGEYVGRDRIEPSSEEHSGYGKGLYFASSPFGTVQFTGDSDNDEFGVAAYRLPHLEDREILIKRLRIGTDKGDHKLVVFPMPWLSRLQNTTEYPYSRTSPYTEQWMLLRAATALREIREETKRIAWLGKSCLGAPRWSDIQIER